MNSVQPAAVRILESHPMNLRSRRPVQDAIV